MTSPLGLDIATSRSPAVAGSFYPEDPTELGDLVDDLLAGADPPEEAVAAARAGLAGILVPHAGLVYSGLVAAVAWKLAATTAPTTIVMLGTNHRAGWLDGIGVWEAGAWQTPLGTVQVDDEIGADIEALGRPFAIQRDAHRSEHSLEVQLPFLCRTVPGVRIVPLTVGVGVDESAIRAGARLGALLAERRANGERISVAISTDMAHHPPAGISEWVTDELAPSILALEPAVLAQRESQISQAGLPGVACGMCGIQPTVVGLAALRAMGVQRGVRLAAATSADAGGPHGRTVGYLSVAFPA